MKSKNTIKAYILDYLQKVIPNFTKKGKIFTCPKCKKESANIFPPDSHEVFCFEPECQKIGNIIDICRTVEFDGNQDISDDDIGKHLIKMFDIKTDNHITQLLETYANFQWDLVPIKNDDKIPVEKKWPTKNHKDIKEWQEWLNNGLGLGVKTGLISNVTIIDVDLITKEESEIWQKGTAEKRIEEIIAKKEEGLKKLKSLPIFNDTLIQDSGWKGLHFFYQYEPDVPKCSFDYEGFHFDVENDGGYVLIEPSTYSGKSRKIIGDKINTMGEDLKQIILDTRTKASKNNDSENVDLTEGLNSEDGTIKGLEGNCNNTFIKVGGMLRKFMNVKQTEQTLALINKHMLDTPMDFKSIKGMCEQIEKYTDTDNKVLYNQIYEFLSRHEEASVRDLRECLNAEPNDIKEVLADLIQDQKVFKQKSLYKVIQKANWKTEFIQESQILPYDVPYFNKYATFRRGDMVCIGAKTGVGKCFGKGTKILMYDGSYKNVEDIKINDKVMGTDSCARTVLETHTGKDNLYKINPTKGESFYVNSEHILPLYMSNTHEFITIAVKDYINQTKTFKHYAKIYKGSVKFKNQDIPIEPYFLGIWLGDGCNSDSRICKTDPEIQFYLSQYANKLGMAVKKYNVQENGQFALKISSEKKVCWQHNFSLNKTLRELNLLNNKHIPNIYKINSRENRLQLLAGLLDTDGYLCNKGFEVTTKYDSLANDIQYLAESLGFLVTKRVKKVKYLNEVRNYWRLYIIGDCSIIPTKIKRKQAEPRKINKNPLVIGFTVEKTKRDNYYGFEIDGNHLHFIEHFIVQHNSYLSLNIIKKFLENPIQPKGGLRYLSSEPGNRFAKIAMELGLKEGDFYFCNHYQPEKIELEDDAVTIIDWLLPDDFSQTANIYKIFAQQLDKHGGLCYIFSQLKDSEEFYAEQMVKFFASFSAKYTYTEKNGLADNQNTCFKVEKIRESKTKQQYITIPTYFNDNKVLELK